VAVKLLTGLFAYSPDRVCRLSRDCKHSLELAVQNLDRMHFMGVAEMWELSMLLLHFRTPSLEPLLGEFALSDEKGKSEGKVSQTVHFNQSMQLLTPDTLSTNRVDVLAFNSSTVLNPHGKVVGRRLLTTRKNDDTDYSEFRSTAPIVYRQQLIQQNSLDLVLYDVVLSRFCDELHRSGLWSSQPLVAAYWHERSPRKTEKCQ
jgi:hypothetical protein